MGAYDDWLTIAGFGGVVLLGYYMHTRGIFNEIFDAISKGLDDIRKAKTDSDKEEPKKPEPKKDEGKSKFAYAYMGQSGPHRAYKSYY